MPRSLFYSNSRSSFPRHSNLPIKKICRQQKHEKNEKSSFFLVFSSGIFWREKLRIQASKVPIDVDNNFFIFFFIMQTIITKIGNFRDRRETIISFIRKKISKI